MMKGAAPNRSALALVLAGGFAGVTPGAAWADCPGSPISSSSDSISWSSGDCSIASSGKISGNQAVAASGTLGSLSNSGTISGYEAGIWNNSGDRSGASIDTLSNSGSISGQYAIFNISGGSIGRLSNRGSISGNSGISNSGSIGTLLNASSGSISSYVGINNGGSIGTLSNDGSISSSFGIDNGGGIGTLSNSGAISTKDTGIQNMGSFFSPNAGGIGTLSNSGSIFSNNPSIINNGRGIANGGTIGTLSNSGSIFGSNIGILNFNGIGNIVSLSNSGAISGTNKGIENQAHIGTLSNSGTISGSVGIANHGSIDTLSNSGAITGSAYAIVHAGDGNALGPILNSGMIAGNIKNDTSQDLTINGGSGATVGILTGYGGRVGAIINPLSNLVFGAGNLLLNDSITVGPDHTVSNTGATVQVNAPMTITGNYSQEAGATLLSGVTTASSYGRLVVAGAATLAADSAVGLRSRGYTFAPGQRFVVVDAAQGASYNEGGLIYSATNADGAPYDGGVTGAVVSDTNGHQDLILLLTGPSSQIGDDPNAVASLAGLSRLPITVTDPALLNLFNAAKALTTPTEANRAGVQLKPVRSDSSSQSATAPTFDALNLVAGRTNSVRLAQGKSGTGIATGEAGAPWGAWGQAFGGHARQGRVDQVDGSHAGYGGLVMGLDRSLSETWRAGAALSYGQTFSRGTGDSAGVKTLINGYGLIGYGSYIGERWYATLSGGAVWQDFNTSRSIAFPGFSGVPTGSFNGWQYVASVEAGYPLAVLGTTVTPLASLAYSHQDQDAYQESGGDGAALSVGASHSNAVRSALGVKVEKAFSTEIGDVTPDLQVRWLHDYDRTRQKTTASFAADPTGQTAFTSVGGRPVSDLAAVSLGVGVLRSDNLSLSARYELQAGSAFVSHTGSLRLRMPF